MDPSLLPSSPEEHVYGKSTSTGRCASTSTSCPIRSGELTPAYGVGAGKSARSSREGSCNVVGLQRYGRGVSAAL